MGCKIVYLESSYPINTRSQRIINSLSDNEVHVCAWDRGRNDIVIENNYSVYRTPNVGYGNKILKLFALLKYALFYLNVVKKENPDVIFCSHWDMLLIATLFKKHEKIIYDNVDIPEFKIGWVENIIVFIEKVALKRVDISLLASRFYLPLYEKFNCIALENLPVSRKERNFKRTLKSNIIKIGFVGSVRHYDILINLIDTIKGNDEFQLHIFGGGIAKNKLESYCNERNTSNVFFHGEYKYDDIDVIYENIDILWAAYPHKSRNVKYAISNKFYESIFYSIPCLFSINTKLGDYVNENRLGVTIDPYSIESINYGISKIVDSYAIIHDNLNLYNNEEDVSWNKNEKILKKVMMDVINK